MKRISLLSLTIVMTLASICFSSCSKNDDSDNQRLVSSYQKTKTGIIGTWVMESYQGDVSLGNPYTSVGWNDPWPYEKSQWYKYTFSNDGTVIDNENNANQYTITLDESEKVHYGKDNDDYFWPFSQGAVVLSIAHEKFYVEIKNDGLLYFYKAQLGYGGEPKYRYKKQ